MSDADSTATQVASNSSVKGVTFAPSPPRSNSGGGKNLMDGSKDSTMSKDDLLMTLKEVRSELAQAKMDLSGEKAIRKRKEKNLVKLAKQLNARSTTIDEQSQQLTALEVRYEATKKELEMLTDQYDEQRAMVRQHDRQTDELRRQVLESKLEQDKLRMKIAQLQMAAEPENADRIVDQTLRESMASTSSRISPSSGGIMVLAAGLLLVPLLVYFASFGDGICAPVTPGTRLEPGTRLDGSSPWWAPEPFKRSTFSILCSDRRRTGIKWTGGSGMSRLLVVDADTGLPGSKQAVLVEKKAMRAIIKSNEIRATMSASGKAENIVAPWRKE